MNFNTVIFPSCPEVSCVASGAATMSEESSSDIVSLADCTLIPDQTHSLRVGIALAPEDSFPETDALVTTCPGLRIGVRTADCVPVLIFASDIRAVAAVHAGWKGSLGGIVDNTLDALCGLGASAGKMHVWFGASICSSCYEVDSDLASRFSDAGFRTCVSFPAGKENKPHLDLQEVNVRRLLRRGVPEERIMRNPHCTFCTTSPEGEYLYHSWRRTSGTRLRNLTTISLVH